MADHERQAAVRTGSTAPGEWIASPEAGQDGALPNATARISSHLYDDDEPTDTDPLLEKNESKALTHHSKAWNLFGGLGVMAGVDEGAYTLNTVADMLLKHYNISPEMAQILAGAIAGGTTLAIWSTEVPATAEEFPHRIQQFVALCKDPKIIKGINPKRVPGAIMALLLTCMYEWMIYSLSYEEYKQMTDGSSNEFISLYLSQLAIPIAICNVSGHLALETPTFVSALSTLSAYILRDKESIADVSLMIGDATKARWAAQILSVPIVAAGSFGLMGISAHDFYNGLVHSHVPNDAAYGLATTAFWIGMAVSMGKVRSAVADNLEIGFTSKPSLPSARTLSMIVLASPFIILGLADALGYGLTGRQGAEETIDTRFGHPIEDPTAKLVTYSIIFSAAVIQRYLFQGMEINRRVAKPIANYAATKISTGAQAGFNKLRGWFGYEAANDIEQNGKRNRSSSIVSIT